MQSQHVSKKRSRRLVSIIVYFLLMVAAALLLHNMNHLILLARNEITEVNLDDYVTTSKGLSWAKPGEVYEDMWESVSIEGWCFAEANQPNDQKEIDILLVSGDLAYKTDAEVTNRSDVNQVYGDKYQIGSTMNGCVTEFSTVGMKNGEYDIYFYAHENAQEKALLLTDYVLVKENKTVTLKPFENTLKRASSLPTPTVENARSDLSMNQEDQRLTVKGWAFCPSMLNNIGKSIEVFLVNEQNIFSSRVRLTDREDVYTHFKDQTDIQGINHGFHMQASLDPVPAGTYDVYVSVQETDTERGLIKLEGQVVINNAAQQ